MAKMKKTRFTLLIIVIVFSLMFTLSSGGFYENRLKEKKTLTEEEIKRFEDDVKNGKNIDINDYLEDDNKDYNNSVSDFNRGVSNRISDVFGSVMKYLFKSVSDAMED